MDAERLRRFALHLDHAVEKAQFGGIIFTVADLAIGGRMFALLNLDAEAGTPASFAAGPERFHELLEREGVRPAPYLARAFWVAAERWDAFSNREWEAEIAAAHALTHRRLPPKTRRLLELPRTELEAAVKERTALEAKRKAAKQAALRHP